MERYKTFISRTEIFQGKENRYIFHQNPISAEELYAVSTFSSFFLYGGTRPANFIKLRPVCLYTALA